MIKQLEDNRKHCFSIHVRNQVVEGEERSNNGGIDASRQKAWHVTQEKLPESRPRKSNDFLDLFVFRHSSRYHLDTHIHLSWPRERTARRLPATPKRPRSQPRSKPSRTKRRPRLKSKNGQRAQRIALRRESSLLNPSPSGYYTEQLSLQCCRRRQESRSRPQEGREGCPPR